MARWFYVVYVGDPTIAGCLNAIRILAEGAVKHPAHITLMGPYDGPRKDAASLSQRMNGQIVRVYSNGTFFSESQNTVFLKATCPAFKELWDKPTVAEFTPHLTIYDGGDRRYASEIADVLLHARIDLSFRADGLHHLQGSSAKRSEAIVSSLPVDLISSIIGRSFGPQLIRNGSHSMRIVCIRRLLEFLASGRASTSGKATKMVAIQ
jgi:hypothetical protein